MRFTFNRTTSISFVWLCLLYHSSIARSFAMFASLFFCVVSIGDGHWLGEKQIKVTLRHMHSRTTKPSWRRNRRRIALNINWSPSSSSFRGCIYERRHRHDRPTDKKEFKVVVCLSVVGWLSSDFATDIPVIYITAETKFNNKGFLWVAEIRSEKPYSTHWVVCCIFAFHTSFSMSHSQTILNQPSVPV